MRKLSLNLVLLMFAISTWGQKNPHGENFKLSCLDCHSAKTWDFTADGKFDHNKTRFALEGQHRFVNCRQCHTSLVFSEAKPNCVNCHTDMHNRTVGMDCAACHNTNSWIVTNITELHQLSRFPLLGAHRTADCAACHTSASQLEFEPLGVECIDCHRPDYMATTKPNHTQVGFSTNCIECHRLDAYEWSSSGINHDFFPLTKGHQINNCAACHTPGNYRPAFTRVLQLPPERLCIDSKPIAPVCGIFDQLHRMPYHRSRLETRHFQKPRCYLLPHLFGQTQW